MVEALGTLPALQVAAIWVNEVGGLSTKALVSICGSTTVERLMMLGFDVLDQQASTIFGALHDNRRLKRLNLSCHLGPLGCKHLSSMLQKNCCLEKLKIEVDNSMASAESLVEVARGLSMNQSLDYFRLSGACCLDMNPTKLAFENTLERNVYLTAFSVFTIHTPKFELYLKLNRAGRRVWLKDGAASERDSCFKALIASNGDIDSIFYILSTNPAICMPSMDR